MVTSGQEIQNTMYKTTWWVEHWDSIQQISEATANGNAMY